MKIFVILNKGQQQLFLFTPKMNLFLQILLEISKKILNLHQKREKNQKKRKKAQKIKKIQIIILIMKMTKQI